MISWKGSSRWLIVALAAGIWPSETAHAFGPTGHRAISRIAERYLTPAAKQHIALLLGKETLPEVSTWADEIRSDPAWDHAVTWHYVSIEDGESYESSQKNADGDIIEAIERFTLILRDPHAPPQQQVEALKWLVHLVGDIHQPLHVSRGADKGGNTLRLRWFSEQTNLHSVWDDKLIDSTKLSFTELAEFIHIDEEKELPLWQNSTVQDWVAENMKYREQVYTIPDSTSSGAYAYSYKNLPLVKLRIAQAGVRLAGLLNKIYAEPPAKP